MKIYYDKDYMLEKCCPHNVDVDEDAIYVGSCACSICKYCVKVTDTYVECSKTN